MESFPPFAKDQFYMWRKSCCSKCNLRSDPVQVWGKAACRLEHGVTKNFQTNNFLSVFPVLREEPFRKGEGAKGRGRGGGGGERGKNKQGEGKPSGLDLEAETRGKDLWSTCFAKNQTEIAGACSQLDETFLFPFAFISNSLWKACFLPLSSSPFLPSPPLPPPPPPPPLSSPLLFKSAPLAKLEKPKKSCLFDFFF